MKLIYQRLRKRILVVIVLALLLVSASAQHTTGRLSIHYLNVGQADAIYIECPETEHHNMLIDSGDVTAMRYPGSPKLFQDQLKALMGTRKHIDVVVSSHPHSDHAGSLLWVLNNYEVGTFIDDGTQYDSATYKGIEDRATALASQGKLKFLHATDLSNSSKDPDFCPATNVDAVLVKPTSSAQIQIPITIRSSSASHMTSRPFFSQATLKPKKRRSC
jgi:competence protein ComEC